MKSCPILLHVRCWRCKCLAGPRGDRERCPQPWMRVAECKVAAMQRGDRRREAQPKTRPRQGPAGFEPHKPLDGVFAVGFGNTIAMIDNSEDGAVAFPASLDQDRLVGFCGGGRI